MRRHDSAVDETGDLNGASEDGFVHEALFYRDAKSYTAGVGDFVRAGLAGGEPVLVAVPAPQLTLLLDALGEDAMDVAFADMTELGRNPSRIIPTVRAWVDEQPPGRVRFVGEPIWAGRRACETIEATRHEALINLAFADTTASILCPYDASRLDPRVIAEAACTHPVLVEDGARDASDAYVDPLLIYAAADHPLTPPPGPVDAHPVTADLGGLRRFVTTQATAHRLAGGRVKDLVLAVNEAATNSLLHSGGRPGIVRMWRDDGALICEVTDGGRITDPLVGRRRPRAEDRDGRGLWLVNQLCDLVELRAEPDGTTLRLHMRLA